MMLNKFVLLLVCSVVIASFSQILLKTSARKAHPTLLQEYLNPYVIIGYGMMVVSTLTTILAYRGLDYKNGPIIESLGYLFIMILSWIFFKEKVTRRKLLGNLLILAGICVFYL
jgi:drug/metabolite transporter (DMT)-like permease